MPTWFHCFPHLVQQPAKHWAPSFSLQCPLSLWCPLIFLSWKINLSFFFFLETVLLDNLSQPQTCSCPLPLIPECWDASMSSHTWLGQITQKVFSKRLRELSLSLWCKHNLKGILAGTSHFPILAPLLPKHHLGTTWGLSFCTLFFACRRMCSWCSVHFLVVSHDGIKGRPPLCYEYVTRALQRARSHSLIAL